MAYRTVTQRCAVIVEDELMAGGTIKPGHLVQIYRASAATKKLRVHPTAGGNAETTFAIEDDMQGKDMADSYSSGDQVRFRTYRSGDLVAAWTYANETIVIGAKLESNGDGTLKVMDLDVASEGSYSSWVATAEEDLSANTTDTLCLVRIR